MIIIELIKLTTFLPNAHEVVGSSHQTPIVDEPTTAGQRFHFLRKKRRREETVAAVDIRENTSRCCVML